jgi:hypothetical protein
MILFSRLFFAFFVGLVILCSTPQASAQAKNITPQIRFDTFNGVYHLSRDNKGLSLLTTEETIVADFPGNGSFYGITRSIPKKYQGHTVNVKVLSITDAAGNSVPYKVKNDASDNLVITTGDPAITLYGSQTIKIKYQTRDVVNLNQKTDEFLLNVNGRGWDQPFSQVNAALYVPAVFKAKLVGSPSCYLALNNTQNNSCQIDTQKTSDANIIISKAKDLSPHQALVMKLNFASSTFTNKQSFFNKNTLALIAVLSIMAVTISSYLFLRKR